MATTTLERIRERRDAHWENRPTDVFDALLYADEAHRDAQWLLLLVRELTYAMRPEEIAAAVGRVNAMYRGAK